MSEIIEFPNASQRRKLPSYGHVRNGPNMQRLLFRSSRLIAESDEADLIRDVGLALDRAETKLRRIKERLKGVQEQAAANVQMLTAAETKLSAAIVAALLSGQR
jgi:hypothetical protein